MLVFRTPNANVPTTGRFFGGNKGIAAFGLAMNQLCRPASNSLDQCLRQRSARCLFRNVIAGFSMASRRPLRTVIGIDIPFDIAGRNVVSQPVLKNLSNKFLFIYRVKNHAGCDPKMPPSRRNFTPVNLHFFFFAGTFSGSFFMLGVSLAQRFATSGSRAKRYRDWAFERNGIRPFLIILLRLGRLEC